MIGIVDNHYKNVVCSYQLTDNNKDPLDESVLDEDFQKILTAFEKAKEK
jgi:hypothetical protein